ncbi:hypothetical protein PPROV_000488200 [Pycnococcus provasolii]|uniref:catechol O-methyltransferase n=1 Tax=Pycnococcus provasolii TaxID=41880 RepID=A0A830HGX1_9CHLO|nr:hypothetical protein PPROV_000488200 [Pycnococcus provasolii]
MSQRCARRCQVRSLGRVEARRARRRTSLVASSERGDDGANQARQELEDELLSDGTGVSMLFPRQVRRFLAGSGAVGCALGIASTAAAAPQSTGNMVENLTINGLGFAACAFWFLQESNEERAREVAEMRREKIQRQIDRGERVEFTTETGSRASKWKQVDDEWILRRLERWGKQDMLPSIGPVKGRLLQSLVREHNPSLVVEVGTFLGYSALTIAQALSEGSRVVTIDNDLRFVLAAKRFCWQANQGTRADGQPRVGRRVSIWYGDAEAHLKEMRERYNGVPQIEMLFIDGDIRQYEQYLVAAEPMMKRGCIVIADNTKVFGHVPEIQSYLQYVRESSRYASSTELLTKYEWRDDVDDAFEVSVFGGL